MGRTPPRLVLASGSPRRAELLERLGLRFDIAVSSIPEARVSGESPEGYSVRLAREKALVVAADRPEALVIGADTIVVLEEDVLEKPGSPGEAVEMLMRLSGREHQVVTAVAVALGERVVTGVERVAVRFRKLDRRLCERYAATGEPMDKAGAYGIQGAGSALVESIEGDFFAVVGLPIVRTLDLLARLGWRYDFDALVPAGE